MELASEYSQTQTTSKTTTTTRRSRNDDGRVIGTECGDDSVFLMSRRYIRLIQRSRKWRDGVRILHDMEELTTDGVGSAVFHNVYYYSAAISRSGRDRRWREAVALLLRMKSRGFGGRGGGGVVRLNAVCCNAAISAAEKGRRWRVALALLCDMQQTESSSGVEGILHPDVTSFNAVISASEKCGRWEEAVALLPEMQQQENEEEEEHELGQGDGSGYGRNVVKVWPDIVTYNAAIGACGRARRSREAFDLFREMREEDHSDDWPGGLKRRCHLLWSNHQRVR